jgi:hypothetical protein
MLSRINERSTPFSSYCPGAPKAGGGEVAGSWRTLTMALSLSEENLAA